MIFDRAQPREEYTFSLWTGLSADVKAQEKRIRVTRGKVREC